MIIKIIIKFEKRTKNLESLNLSEMNQLQDAIQESSIPIIVQVFDWAEIPESFQKNILQSY